MKRKFAAIILGLTLAAASMGVSATENASAQNLNQEAARDKTFGTVKKIDGKTIFVALSEPNKIPEEDPEIAAEKKRQENLKNNANVEDAEHENVNLEENTEDVETIYLEFNQNTEDTENADIEVNSEDADIEVNAEDTEASKSEAKEVDEKKALENLMQDGVNYDVAVIEVADDATIYCVPNTKDGNSLMKECAAEDVELPKLETLEFSAIEEGNEICIWHDEEGKAVLLLVLDPDAETAAE